ncbi:MAG: hypothetical protein ABWY77_06265 [Acidimicrobiia bacterium]
MADVELTPTPERRSGLRGAIAVGLVAALAVIAVPVVANLGDDGASVPDPRVTKTDSDDGDTTVALATVRAAVGNTVAAGSYEADSTTHTTQPGNDSANGCTSTAGPNGVVQRSCYSSGPSSFDVTGHRTINFDPYVSRSVTTSSYGPRTLYVTSTMVWLTNGGASNIVAPGTPLPQFAGAVRGALGPSQAALAMINMASPGGELNLVETAIADATPSGTGSVDGVDVTYYDVTIDMAKLADRDDLNEVQRATIADALPLLEQGGYQGTTERIGIDDIGYIREITANKHFGDGSTGVSHTILRNFGCAERIAPPGQPTPAPVEPGCTSPIPPTTTTVPSTTTTVAPTSSTTTSTSTPVTSVPPSTTVPTFSTIVPTTSTTSTTKPDG